MPTVGLLRYLEALPQGASLANLSSRSARTLVLLHAFPLNARMWEAQFALAALGWRVIAPHVRGMGMEGAQLPGQGSAPAGTESATVDDYAADVIDLLDALHVEDAVIGGLSMGGYVALAIFRHAPRYFRGIVLADTRSQADTPEGREGRQRTRALLRESGPQAVLEDMLPKLLGETTRRDRPEVANLLRQLVASNSQSGVAGAINVLMTRPD